MTYATLTSLDSPQTHSPFEPYIPTGTDTAEAELWEKNYGMREVDDDGAADEALERFA